MKEEEKKMRKDSYPPSHDLQPIGYVATFQEAVSRQLNHQEMVLLSSSIHFWVSPSLRFMTPFSSIRRNLISCTFLHILQVTHKAVPLLLMNEWMGLLLRHCLHFFEFHGERYLGSNGNSFMSATNTSSKDPKVLSRLPNNPFDWMTYYPVICLFFLSPWKSPNLLFLDV